MSIMFRDKSIIGLIFQVPSLGWYQFMYRSNRNFNITPATWQPPGHLTFWKIIVQISPYPNENAVQMPHILESIQVSNASIPRTLKNFLYYPLCRSSSSRVCRHFAIDSTVFIIYSVKVLLYNKENQY